MKHTRLKIIKFMEENEVYTPELLPVIDRCVQLSNLVDLYANDIKKHPFTTEKSREGHGRKVINPATKELPKLYKELKELETALCLNPSELWRKISDDRKKGINGSETVDNFD